MSKLFTIAAAVLLACGVSTAALAATSAPRARSSCVAVTFGWRTSTGHEADEQITMCGTDLRRDQICNVNEPLQPGAIGECYALPERSDR